MFDVSFIIPCCNTDSLIGQTIDQLLYILNLCSDIEIVILNCLIDKMVSSEIANYEEKWPNNILIVNIDGEKNTDELIKLGIDYSDSLCYMYLPFPVNTVDPSIWDGLVANERSCDKDTYKYIKDKYTYISLSYGKDTFLFDQVNEMPQLTDYRQNAGNIDKHYFFQDIYVANKILKKKHKHIYDIGSRLDGYISHLLAMDISVTMIDIRPLPVSIKNIQFLKGDATNLSDINDNSLSVLSCLHALEHFGLGRYGDDIDPDGWKKAILGMKRIIAPDGYLYLSVPVGTNETVMFNAHRVFNPLTLIKSLVPEFFLTEFTLIHDFDTKTFQFSHDYTYDRIAQTFEEIRNTHMGCYDCGIFIFIKNKHPYEGE